LAPTVLVSFALVGASIAGVLYLNQVHANLSKELTENVESTKAAQRLDAVTTQLISLLRGPHDDPAHLAEKVEELNAQAHDCLADSSALANLEREKELVKEIGDGLDKYQNDWDHRPQQTPEAIPDYDQRLARLLGDKVLHPCKDLRNYNQDQTEASNHENQRIIERLSWGLLAVGLGAPVSGLLLGYAMARSLHHSIYQLSVGIRDAAGRLNRELGSVTLQEQGDLPDLHRQMQGVLKEIERVVEQLQQREREVLRAEQLAAVGQVAAGVAHELRNPLTSVKMLVQTGLEDKRQNGLPRDDLAIIEHEIRRMEQCIQLFLDFARPPRSERRQTDLLGVVRRALALVEGRARRQRVTLDAKLPEESIRLFLDPEQIHQVVVNLLLNALDALPRGGTIGVSVFHNGGATVRVRDTGSGIAPHIRERLFQPFVSSKETGLGLGLSICKRLIEAHTGTIHGANAPEGGTVFEFTLPG
jgi:signal transduction histidine kinase